MTVSGCIIFGVEIAVLDLFMIVTTFAVHT